MNSDEFEQRLRDQPLRPIPAAWREEILQGAAMSQAMTPASHAEAGPHPPTPAPNQAEPDMPLILPASWREWLWPSPSAWAGLAAMWMVIAALSVSDLQSTPMARPNAPKPSPDVASMLAAQRRERVRLLEGAADGAPGPARNAPAKDKTPGPRGEALTPPRA